MDDVGKLFGKIRRRRAARRAARRAPPPPPPPPAEDGGEGGGEEGGDEPPVEGDEASAPAGSGFVISPIWVALALWYFSKRRR